MTRLILPIFAILLAAIPAVANVLECTNPDTDEKFKMSLQDIKGAVRLLTKELEREQVHMLDMPTEIQDGSRDLKSAIAAKDWCKGANIARRIEDAIYNTRVHPEFVNQKFRRVELWVRGGKWSETDKMAAERLIAIAAAKISEQDHVNANKQLNKTIQTIFHTKGLWALPDELPDIDKEAAGGAQAEIDADDVAGGCPTLAEKGSGTADDLTDVRRKITRAMNSRKVRTSDIKGGSALAADLASYKKLRATWPAIRVACALLHKIKTTEIGLGMTMARYHLVTKLRRTATLSEEQDKRFRELVRQTSDAIADTDYTKAHEHLEEMMIMLGEPVKPADTLKIPD